MSFKPGRPMTTGSQLPTARIVTRPLGGLQPPSRPASLSVRQPAVVVRRPQSPSPITNSTAAHHTPPSSMIEGSSILLMATISLVTPSVLASCACSRVWPPRSKPVSNSPCGQRGRGGAGEYGGEQCVGR
jgi:hypothetical protein